MFRKLAASGSGLAIAATVGTLPAVAFAAEPNKFRPVYDDEVARVSEPLPGTTEKATPRQTLLTETETVLERDLGIESVQKNGFIYRVSSALEKYIGKGRESLETVVRKSEKVSVDLNTTYTDGERRVLETISSLRGKNEDLLPGSIYVLIAGLTGSIVARRRNFALRFLSPLVFGAAGMAYFLPRTWQNTRSLAWEYEQQAMPEFARKHEEAGKNVEDLQKQTKELYGQSEKQVRNSLKSVRQTIKDWTGY